MYEVDTRVEKVPLPEHIPLSEELMRVLAEVYRIFARRGQQVLAETQAQANGLKGEQRMTSVPLEPSRSGVTIARPPTQGDNG